MKDWYNHSEISKSLLRFIQLKEYRKTSIKGLYTYPFRTTIEYSQNSQTDNEEKSKI